MHPKRLFKIAALAALAATGPAPQAAVLTFDDLVGTGPTGPGLDWFTADYQGFRFGNNSAQTNTWFHTDESASGGSLPEYTPVSGARYVATCAPDPTQCPSHTGALHEATLPITSAIDIVFNGAYFSGYDTVYYELYDDGALVHTSAASPDLGGTGVPVFVASGYFGAVDQVVVRGRQGFFAMDDFTYSVVSEPGGLALVALAGLMGLATRRRLPLAGG